MDLVAITHLRARYRDALSSSEMYRGAAKKIPPMREFYDALATTYARAAQEMELFLDKVDRMAGASEEAA